MDGLECSVIYRSSLNCELRIDSEYHKKRFLQDDYSIHKYHTVLIGAIATVSDGQHGYHEEDASSPIHMLTAKNTKDWFANLVDTIRIAKWVDDNNKRSSLSVDDIILSTRGTVGKCALVKADILPANLDQDVARISFTNAQIAPAFVLCYLNSIFGQDWMVRNQTGMVQQGLSLEKVRQIPIPQMSITFQDKICEIVENAFARKKESVWSYDAANRILGDMIGIKDLCATTISKRSFFQSFVKTGRLDAEYYQPKYDEYASIIGHFNGGSSLIRTEFSQVKKICDRKLSSYKYVEIGDVNVSYGFATANEVATPDLPDNAKIMAKKDDIIISTVRPNRGAVAVLEDDNLLVSGAFTVLREKGTYKKEVLQVLLRLPFYRDWLLRYNVGTSYPVIKDSDVLNMPIPLFDKETQNGIVQKVKESSDLRNQSKQLLEYAKQAVEMAIEQGEEVALKWLKEKIPAEV